MLSDDDARIIEASAPATADAAALLRWIDELLRDRRERVDQIERARQRLRPFAYFRDVIGPA
jgi:hypothetical protein